VTGPNETPDYADRPPDDRIIGRARIEQHLPDHADMHLRNRIAIGPGFLQRHGAQNAGSAATIFHHHGLAEAARGVVCHDAKADIRRSPRRPGNDQLDRPIRETRLCQGGHGEQC
jgi:hypothetical protein